MVVLLHPVGLNGGFWDGVVAELEGEMRLIAPDARGHGESDVAPGSFTLDDMADDTIGLIREVGSPPVVLVGCSMGGMIAQGVALRAPELVRGLVVTGTGASRTDEARRSIWARADAAEAGMPAVLDQTTTRWFDEKFAAAHPGAVTRIRDWLLEADPVVHARTWRAMADLDYGRALGRLACPALMVAATDDRSVPPETLAELARSLPDAAYRELEGAGHLGPYQRPREFAALLRDFVRGLPT